MRTLVLQPCLWCGKIFDWTSDMFRFCDKCLANIERFNLDTVTVETVLMDKRQNGLNDIAPRTKENLKR